MKILKEKALPEIENYMFEDHYQIRVAATECMCNLVSCKEVRAHHSILYRVIKKLVEGTWSLIGNEVKYTL